MKKTKRIVAFVLATLVLSASMIGCNENVEEKNNSDLELSEELDVPVGVAEGKTFTLYSALGGLKGGYSPADQSGDGFAAAVMERNDLVEAHTGADLVFVFSTRTSNGADQDAENSLIRTLIQSGDSTYDAYIHAYRQGMMTLVEEGMFVDWNTIPYINISNPWWYSNVERDLCFADKVYYMTGDYNVESFAQTNCLLFNKTMCDELGLEYPYQYVLDGTWTHDKFVEYIKKATGDLNGDGALDHDNDRYGFAGWYYEQVGAVYVGYGGNSIVKDENNLPVINVNNERTFTVIDKMIEVFDCDGAFFESATYGAEDKMFNEGRLLFNDSFFGHVAGARSLENIDVGFIPYPKLNEEQEEYYARTAVVSGLTYIPITNSDLEKTGAVLEAMAHYSSITTMPAYFDVLITIKSTRDSESELMIPIIREAARFENLACMFNGSAMIAEGRGNTLGSLIAGQMESWESKLESVIEFYSK